MAQNEQVPGAVGLEDVMSQLQILSTEIEHQKAEIQHQKEHNKFEIVKKRFVNQ